jgi:hypothetical protein
MTDDLHLFGRSELDAAERADERMAISIGVTYGNGIFVAVGRGGTILTSTDGVNWTQQTWEWPTSNDLYGVTYGWPIRGGGEERHHPHLHGRSELDASDLADEQRLSTA